MARSPAGGGTTKQSLFQLVPCQECSPATDPFIFGFSFPVGSFLLHEPWIAVVLIESGSTGGIMRNHNKR